MGAARWVRTGSQRMLREGVLPVRRVFESMLRCSRSGRVALFMAVLSIAGVMVAPIAHAAGGSATLTVNTWSVDTSTGKVTYNLSVSGEGQCTSGCSVAIDLGRDDANGVTQRVGGLSVTYSSQSVTNGVWTAAATSSGDRVTLTETTSVRAVYNDSSGSYPGPWQPVSAPYPAPAATLQVAAWTPDTETGKITYDVTGSGATLAKSGGPCENTWCTMKVEAGRLDAAGAVKLVTTLSCTGGGSTLNAWTMTVRCTATAKTMPEITRLRPVVVGSSTLAGAWQTVSDAYPAPTVAFTSVAWTPDTATGKVTYNVTARAAGLAKAGGPCENAWCTMKVEAGRVGSTGAVAVVATLSCTGGGSVNNTWTMTVNCVATAKVLPEITRLRAVVTGTSTLASPWYTVSPAYPDPTATLTVTSWVPNTETGQVTYDVAGYASGLAKAGGPCENAWCTMKVETGRVTSTGAVAVVSTLSCTGGGSVNNPWTMTVRCTGTNVTLPEITRLRPVVTGSTTTLTGAWHVVSDPYPDPTVTLPSVSWSADPATGQVTYAVTGRATSLAKSGGPCENAWCSMKVEAGRLKADGTVEVVSTLSCTGGSSANGVWTMDVSCSANAVTLPEITRIRPVLTGKYVLTGEWRVVHDPYPAPSIGLSDVAWSVDTDTGKVTYTLTGTATTLAKAGGPCENAWCTMKVEAGRPAADGTAEVVATLTCTGGDSVMGAWKIVVQCTATAKTMPEITMIRPVVNGKTALVGDWVTVSQPYPAPVVTLGPVTWTPNTATGQVTYDVTATAVTLAKADGPCENAWCTLTVEAARVHQGELETVATLSCTPPDSVNNAWKIAVQCTATDYTMREVTRIRAVVNGASQVTSEWFVVSPAYPDPTAALTVGKWDFTGETGTGSGYFDVDIRGVAEGLARAGGPCETSWCSISFEGGLPDTQGIIRARSRLTADQSSSVPPGTWRASITRIDNHTMVPDQLYLRVGVYQDGYLVLATPWQERSSVALAGPDGGYEAAFLASAAPALLAQSTHDPCIETFGSAEAPRTQNSSLNDWQWACETERAAGKTRWQQFAEVGKRYGKRAVVVGGATAATLLGIQAPAGEPVTALQDDPEFLRRVDRLLRRLSYRTATQELADRQLDRRKVATTVTERCYQRGLVAGQADCDSIAIWIPGDDVSQVAGHALDAIAGGQPFLLSYASEVERNAVGIRRSWLNAVQYHDVCPDPRPSGRHCDEYPYFSTTRSGPGASLRLVDDSQNTSEGAMRRSFWTACGINSAPVGTPDRDFVVIPMPDVLPSMGFCKA